MAMQLQEIHPALVHYPLTLLPAALIADAIGNASDGTGGRALREVGRWGMALAAGSAALSAVFGLVAQEESNAEGEARDILVTHRTLNVMLVSAATGMAWWRWNRLRAEPGYLALGMGAIAALGYSAYLGGKMVYEHGVGVAPADAAARRSPELTAGMFGRAARAIGSDVASGVRHVAQDTAGGALLPWLTHSDGAA
ncbi:MAG TPA: DUF2231 domain-containing protein [Gemmatimonadales bacterium]|nr:DUF2231 domain-containing protein [Gemmatimonadales bacterium]